MRAKYLPILIDCSASMGKNGALATAAHELLASLKSLPASAQFQVFVYNSQARPLVPRLSGHWLTPTPENLAEVAAALAALPPEGSTDHTPALKAAFSESVSCPFSSGMMPSDL